MKASSSSESRGRVRVRPLSEVTGVGGTGSGPGTARGARNHGTYVPSRTRRAIYSADAPPALETTARVGDPVVATGRCAGLRVGGAADGLPVAGVDAGHGHGGVAGRLRGAGDRAVA